MHNYFKKKVSLKKLENNIIYCLKALKPTFLNKNEKTQTPALIRAEVKAKAARVVTAVKAAIVAKVAKAVVRVAKVVKAVKQVINKRAKIENRKKMQNE